MNKTLASISLIVLLVLVAGCQAATSAPQASRGAVAPKPAEPPASSRADTVEGYNPLYMSEASGQTQAANAAGAERMIVYTGQLALVVQDTRVAVEQISQIVKDVGGFVVSSNIYQDQGHARAKMTVRVPGEDLAQLKATLVKIKALATSVESENLNGQDVTDQYADTQAEIENLTAQRNSYRSLLDRATKMEDILNIQTRLDQVQGQINKLTGQQLKLKENVKFATVSIDITPDALAQPIVIGAWRPAGTARDAFRALLNALKFIGDVLIWAVICVLPIGLLLGAPAFLIGRLVLSRRRKKATPAPPSS